jgi:hypothetical protein
MSAPAVATASSGAKPNTKAQLMTAFLRKCLKMVVAARCGLPGNVRNPDSSFGLRTKQLNHGDSGMLDDVTWDLLRCPMEIRVSLCFTGSASASSELVLEHWLVKFAGQAKPSHRMDDKALYERLSVAVRSLQAILSILPAFNFLQAQMRYVGGGSMAASVAPGMHDMRGGANACTVSRLERSRNGGGSRGMRFERHASVPHWMVSGDSNNHTNNSNFRMAGPEPVGILRVDLFQHNSAQPSMTNYRNEVFAAERLETQTSYGPLQVDVRYRSQIMSANMETPTIINDYYVAAPGKQGGAPRVDQTNRRIRRMSEGIPIRGGGGGGGGGRMASASISIGNNSSARGSKPMAIPGHGMPTTDAAARSGRARRNTHTSHTSAGNAGIRSLRPSSFSPPLTTGLGLLQAESAHHRRQNNNMQVPQPHNQQAHFYGSSVPNKVSWGRDDMRSLYGGGPNPVGGGAAHAGSPIVSPPVGTLPSNLSGLVGTPPLHPHRSPSLSPSIGPSPTSLHLASGGTKAPRGGGPSPPTFMPSPASTAGDPSPGLSPIGDLLNPPSGTITLLGHGAMGSGSAADVGGGHPQYLPLPFLASSAPRADSHLTSPFWNGLPSPQLGASPPMIGLIGYMGNLALSSDGAIRSMQQPQQQQQQQTMMPHHQQAMTLQPYSHRQQQQQRQHQHQHMMQQPPRQTMGADAMFGGPSPSSMGSFGSYGSYGGEGGGMLGYLKYRQNNYNNAVPGPGGGGGGGGGDTSYPSGVYGSSPTQVASGWIEYTRTAGTAAPDSFSPWGQTLGVVASRSRAAAKNEVLAKKAGVSYAHVDTSWLDAKRGYTSANAPIPPDTHVGALAVDAPPPSDDLSRIGAFLQVLSDHERLHQEDRVQQEGNGGGSRISCRTVADALKFAASSVKKVEEAM